MHSSRHDVFLSYSADDRAAVEELAARLVREDIQPWLDTWSLIPGQPRQEAIEAALYACASCAVFIGPGGTGPWQHEELRAAIDRRVEEGWKKFRVIPVLLPGAERGERSRLPGFLLANTWVEFRQTLDDEAAFRRLTAGIRGVEPGQIDGVAVYEGTPPYRGLQAFDFDDARFFFGREALVEWLLNALQPIRGMRPGSRFLGVIGPSGSGKSSLVRAGLMPALRRGMIAESDSWPVAVCTPSEDLLESLALSLLTVEGEQVSLFAFRDLMRDLRSDRRALHQWVRTRLINLPSSRRLFLLVDQFEEIFTLCSDEQRRQAAIENLLHAATVPGGQTIVVLTLRADFYGRCATYPQLAAALSDYQMLIGPMSDGELGRAIERPAQLVGCEFEPGLVETLLQAVRGQPGTLPLLQHALLELWSRRDGRRLTYAAYQAISGVAGAIERHAEAIFSSLQLAEQAICRRILLRLTQPGEGTEVTRRRAALRELVTQAHSAQEVARVVGILADARLLTTSRDSQTDEQIVDVSHEALISSWPRLGGWIDEDRTSLMIHRRLAGAVAEWQRLGEDEDALFRGARLAEVVEWQRLNEIVLNEQERRFIQASSRLQQRAAQATQQRETELARRLVAGARVQISLSPDLGILLAREAVRLAQTPETEDVLREALLALQAPRALAGHAGPVASATFSPDSAYLVSAGWDSRAVVWHMPAGTVMRVLTGHPDPETVIAFTHHSLQRSWARGQLAGLTPARGHTGPLTGCWVSPGGQHVLTTSRDRSGCIWNITLALGEPFILAGHRGRVIGGAFRPDGQSVATASTDATARIWSVATGECLGELAGHAARINAVAFSPDGRTLATASADATVRLWDAEACVGAGELRGHAGPVTQVAFHPAGHLVATASQDGSARLWDLRAGQSVGELRGHSTAVRQVAFSPDGQLALTASDDGTVRLWGVETGVGVGELRGHTGPVSHIAIHPGGRFVATASQDGSARLWSLGTGQSIGALQGRAGPINHIAFSPDGKFMAASGQDGSVQLHDCRILDGGDLLALAEERVGRELTREEREHYL